MKGKVLALVLLLGLRVWVQDGAASQIDQKGPGGRCRCLRVTSERVDKSWIKKVEILSARSYCPKMEVVITTKKNHTICIDPEAEWFKNLLPVLMQDWNKVFWCPMQIRHIVPPTANSIPPRALFSVWD